MQLKATLYKSILFITFLALVCSCSIFEPRKKGDIEAIDFIDTYDIEQGECCNISWNIKNADRIVFLTKNFPDNYSVQVCPNDTTIYTIATANAEQTKFFKVKVNVNPFSPKIKTGSEFVEKSTDTISIELSDYYSGTIPIQYNSKINKLKITKFSENDGQLSINFLPLDIFGNFIDGLDFGQNNLNIELIDESARISCKVNSVERYQNKTRNHFYFVIETSFAAQFAESIINQLRSALLSFSPNDLISVYFVNHNINKFIQSTDPKTASLQLSSHNVMPRGLNSTANGLIEVLEDIQNSSNKNQIEPIVVLCNLSGDNSSITFTLSDVAKVARKQKIPIYSIGIGLDAKSYQLSPLSNSTFAKDYIIAQNEINDVRKIINEIYYSQKNGYKASAKITAKISTYKLLNLQISTHNGDNFVEDRINFYVNPPQIYVPFQILSLFDHLSSDFPKEYLSKLDELSELLRDNPDAQVELIGYSNFETLDDDSDNNLALERAMSIKQKLLQNEVGVSQVTTKTKGNMNPLYYFPKVEWQVAVNRRVEIRWLDPSLLPFEILAQNAVSETEANKYVDEWETIGYRSYYQRNVIRNQEVMYRVKLWGFATQSEAENAIRVLSFKFPNIKFTLE